MSAPATRLALQRSELRRIEGTRGWLEIGVLAPGVIFQRAEGHADAKVATELCQRLDELLRQHRFVELFDDWYGLTSYESSARQVLERWTTANRSSLQQIHVLTSSKLVSMAVVVSNLVTGGVTIPYTDRAAFERALERRLADGKPAN